MAATTYFPPKPQEFLVFAKFSDQITLQPTSNSASVVQVFFLNCSDLDEKFRKRDRYSGGITSDFKEKDGYKPDVKLEYVDDSGRMLNEKEAFRQLSHRFHGKGSGKRKTEKRSKKTQEENVIVYSC